MRAAALRFDAGEHFSSLPGDELSYITLENNDEQSEITITVLAPSVKSLISSTEVWRPYSMTRSGRASAYLLLHRHLSRCRR